jgi:membrane associated rhomboid family serine protease
VTKWTLRLLVANVAVFFIQMFAPFDITSPLALVPRLMFVRPWTLVTYMFLHGSITHILFNMIVLYFFGPQVESRMGSARFLTLYFVGGISGGLLSILLAPHAAVIGASAALFGVMLAFARFWPRAKILIWGILPIEAWLLVLLTTLFALYSGFTGSRGGVADFAHLGGFVGAWLYLIYLDRVRGSRGFQKRTVAPVQQHSLSNWRKVDPQRVHEVNRDEVNRILDKINATGLASLTPQERLFLSNFVPMDDRKPPVS